MPGQIMKKLRSNLIPTVAFLVVLPLLVSLGFWQLDRARQKTELQALYDARLSDTPVSVGETIANPEDLRFYRVAIKGYYEPDYSILLDNRVHEGMVGYFVVTPMRIAGTQTRVLVNRGWVPLGKDRSELPTVTPPKGLQQVVGVATVPHEKVFRLAPPPPLSAKWQTVWQHMDMARYAEAVPFPIQPVVVLLDPGIEVGGFIRKWKRLDTGIAVHEGYAFQWFSLAVTLTAIYIFFTFVRRPNTNEANRNLTREHDGRE